MDASGTCDVASRRGLCRLSRLARLVRLWLRGGAGSDRGMAALCWWLLRHAEGGVVLLTARAAAHFGWTSRDTMRSQTVKAKAFGLHGVSALLWVRDGRALAGRMWTVTEGTSGCTGRARR